MSASPPPTPPTLADRLAGRVAGRLAGRLARRNPVPPGDAGPPPTGLRLVELDVRPTIARGGEPFAEIMSAVRRLGDDGALVLRSPFDPVPLHSVLARRGFARHTRAIGGEDRETVYWRPGRGDAPAAEPGPRVAAAPAPMAPGAGRDGRVLDVRGLTPPEPMRRTLAALEDVPDGERLVQVNDRVPAFLLPLLEERGFSYEITSEDAATVTTIWRAGR